VKVVEAEQKVSELSDDLTDMHFQLNNGVSANANANANKEELEKELFALAGVDDREGLVTAKKMIDMFQSKLSADDLQNDQLMKALAQQALKGESLIKSSAAGGEEARLHIMKLEESMEALMVQYENYKKSHSTSNEEVRRIRLELEEATPLDDAASDEMRCRNKDLLEVITSLKEKEAEAQKHAKEMAAQIQQGLEVKQALVEESKEMQGNNEVSNPYVSIYTCFRFLNPHF